MLQGHPSVTMSVQRFPYCYFPDDVQIVFFSKRLLVANISIFSSTLQKSSIKPSQYICYKMHPSCYTSSRKIVVVRQVVHHHLDRNSIAVDVQDTSVHEPASITLQSMEGNMSSIQ